MRPIIPGEEVQAQRGLEHARMDTAQSIATLVDCDRCPRPRPPLRWLPGVRGVRLQHDETSERCGDSEL
eukprot:9867704-Heterocapsa_arctica.AAC.1